MPTYLRPSQPHELYDHVRSATVGTPAFVTPEARLEMKSVSTVTAEAQRMADERRLNEASAGAIGSNGGRAAERQCRWGTAAGAPTA